MRNWITAFALGVTFPLVSFGQSGIVDGLELEPEQRFYGNLGESFPVGATCFTGDVIEEVKSNVNRPLFTDIAKVEVDRNRYGDAYIVFKFEQHSAFVKHQKITNLLPTTENTEWFNSVCAGKKLYVANTIGNSIRFHLRSKLTDPNLAEQVSQRIQQLFIENSITLETFVRQESTQRVKELVDEAAAEFSTQFDFSFGIYFTHSEVDAVNQFAWSVLSFIRDANDEKRMQKYADLIQYMQEFEAANDYEGVSNLQPSIPAGSNSALLGEVLERYTAPSPIESIEE